MRGPVRTVIRNLVYALAAVMLLVAGAVMYVDGQVPAGVPSDAPPWSLSPLADALVAVDAKGVVDLAELKKRHASLETYLASLAGVQPDTLPTVEARLAFWLNAYHAMVLEELLDARGPTRSSLDEWLHARAIGGHRQTRAAIFRHLLSQSGDARVVLSVATGAKGTGVLDGAPFDPDSLNLQLDDAVRRFVQRKDHFAIDGTKVRLSELFLRYREDFLAALPDERKNVLQVVWAYLPDACGSDASGCVTRNDLDKACGNRFDACTIEWLPVDETLAVKN